MLSRTLILAAVALYIGSFETPAVAQNLEAGKTPSQLFTATCELCHKSPRGLLKTVAPGALPGFLRQHYTTSQEMAAALSAYVLSNGASDRRIGGDGLTREGQDSRTLRKPAEPAATPKETRVKSRREPRGEKGREEEGAAPRPKEDLKQAGEAAQHPGEGVEAPPKGRSKREKRKPKPVNTQSETKKDSGAATAEPDAAPKNETAPEPKARPAESSEAPKAQTEPRPDAVPAIGPARETPSVPADQPVAAPSAAKAVEQPEKSDASPKSAAGSKSDSTAEDQKPAGHTPEMPSSGMPVFDIKPQTAPAPSEPSPGSPNAPVQQ